MWVGCGCDVGVGGVGCLTTCTEICFSHHLSLGVKRHSRIDAGIPRARHKTTAAMQELAHRFFDEMLRDLMILESSAEGGGAARAASGSGGGGG